MDKKFSKKINKKEEELNTQNSLKAFDSHFEKAGLVAGVDEAGRGPLAGPVVVAAVILPKEIDFLGINDSKKITEKKREELFEKITKEAVAYSIIEVSEKEIDELNILAATKLGVKKAVESLKVHPGIVLTDALSGIDTKYNIVSVVKGDAKSLSIAAASILAKVHRDRKMKELAKEFPNYGFEKHKGYGTKKHYEALKEFGMCKIHRKSFVHLDENGDRIKVKR